MLTIDGGKSQDDFHDEKVEDIRRKIGIKPLKESKLGRRSSFIPPSPSSPSRKYGSYMLFGLRYLSSTIVSKYFVRPAVVSYRNRGVFSLNNKKQT